MNWQPRSKFDGKLWAGDNYLVAVAVCSPDKDISWWELSVITITEDGCDVHGEPWDWDWTDVDYCIPVSEILPPFVPF